MVVIRGAQKSPFSTYLGTVKKETRHPNPRIHCCRKEGDVLLAWEPIGLRLRIFLKLLFSWCPTGDEERSGLLVHTVPRQATAAGGGAGHRAALEPHAGAGHPGGILHHADPRGGAL